ncbi:hypothetical protein BGZ61DRAFT_538975 [Ilyonectria robusta]|uniref:uncharacterized protein n=1 Tax=Ilyonectria robusta TaxID=1079257 RepID=UPI001E8DB349|nr:uncharacterized protein BGZ61DRAFT_538975 [Ilyonectria robusta]KAH8664900.1 hypothetical protein BGZ61DRAFT_538975 [Ilyonectria robusta]
MDCNIDSPVEVLPNTININYTLPDRGKAEMKYTVQDRDTCGSILESYSVSRATLCYLNPELANCQLPATGIELCLPDQCEWTYTVQPKDDSCDDAAVIYGTSWKNIVDWDAGIDSRCWNIWSTIPFWDRVLSVSSPGGEFVPPP